MKIAIMGSGGLGGYFGARLVEGGADVHFVARGKHLEAMRRDGLRIVGPEPIHAPKVQATDDPTSIGVADVVMLCVKLWDTEQAIAQIRPMVGAATLRSSRSRTACLKDQYLRAAFDERQLMGGVGYVATTIEAPGVIRQTGPMQRLLFGEFDGSRSSRAARPCWRPAWPAASRPSSPTTSCARSGRSTSSWWRCPERPRRCARPSGRSARIRRPAPSCIDVMREVVAVGRAHGVALPEDYAQVRLQLADDVSPDMTSSMHHDLERGNRLEVRWLSGGVVELGQAKGVPTPLNRAIADILALHADGGRHE